MPDEKKRRKADERYRSDLQDVKPADRSVRERLRRIEKEAREASRDKST